MFTVAWVCLCSVTMLYATLKHVDRIIWGACTHCMQYFIWQTLIESVLAVLQAPPFTLIQQCNVSHYTVVELATCTPSRLSPH
jgi:hypothetical protein